MECYPDAFQLMFENKECSIYEINGEGFLREMTSWSPELVCENEAAVINEISVDDLYLRLWGEETKGNLIIRRYEDNADFKSIVSEHIVSSYSL